MKDFWKSKEDALKEEEEKEKIKEHFKNKETAKEILMAKIAKDYISSKIIIKEEKDMFTDLYELYDNNYREYEKGDMFNCKGDVFVVIKNHISEPNYIPFEKASLYSLFYQNSTSIGESVFPQWEGPVESIYFYNTGDLVLHEGFIWESEIDNNSWEPGIFGWSLYPS